jgi:hypothetical protein
MLVGLFPRDFPKHLLRRAENVLALRQKYVFHAGGDSYFFPVPTSEKRRFVEDLVALYEACLIDAGRLDKETREIIYPQDAPNEPAKRRRRSKTR